jgi:hypothetical protein
MCGVMMMFVGVLGVAFFLYWLFTAGIYGASPGPLDRNSPIMFLIAGVILLLVGFRLRHEGH